MELLVYDFSLQKYIKNFRKCWSFLVLFAVRVDKCVIFFGRLGILLIILWRNGACGAGNGLEAIALFARQLVNYYTILPLYYFTKYD